MVWQQRGNVYRPRWKLNSGCGGSCGGGRWQWFAGALILVIAVARLFDPRRAHDWDAESRPYYNGQAAALENVISLPPDDPQMLAATQQAQQSLDTFLLVLEHPAATQHGFHIKAKFVQQGKVEFMWVEGVRFDGLHFHGWLANEPDSITNVRLGDQVIISRSDVTDWCFEQDGELVGGFSIRALAEKVGTAR